MAKKKRPSYEEQFKASMENMSNDEIYDELVRVFTEARHWDNNRYAGNIAGLALTYINRISEASNGSE